MLVAQLRGAYGRHLGEPAWTGFVRRLQAVSAAFTRLWDEHEVASQPSYLKIFRHPAYATLTLTTTSLAVQAMPGTRIVVYRPADEATREAISRLLAGEGADAHSPRWAAHQRRTPGRASWARIARCLSLGLIVVVPPVVAMRMVSGGGSALTGRVGRHSTAGLAVVAAATLA